MNKKKNLTLTAFLLFATTGCTPDLVVKDLDIYWDNENKNATAVIENIGNRNAGEFLVYFNADENPGSLNRIPQVRHSVPDIAKGASITLYSDFAPLAHPDNNNLGNVYRITVIADPKGMVNESNENNNETDSPTATATVVDQSNLISEGNYVVDGTQEVSQTFTVTQSNQLLGIEVAAVRCQATGTDILTLEVGQGESIFGAISITGAEVPGPGQCGVVPPALQMNVQGPGYFDLSSLNINLLPGTTYYFKVSNTSNRDFRIGMSSDLYGNGTALANGSIASADLSFKIILSP